MEKILKNNKGITLIALVITIIVLLILAGISIATLTGNNGLLNKTTSAKEENEKAEYKESLELIGAGLQIDKRRENWSTEVFMGKYKEAIENDKKYESSSWVERNKKIEVKTKEGYVFHVEEEKVEFVEKQEGAAKTKTLVSQVEVGDYVAYKAGTHPYTYTSEKGTGTTGGNGYDTPQTFTSNDNIKWRVLSKENNEVVLISEEPLQTDDNKEFYLNGAIGYLYAEEELNKICSIYGHGVGANTNKRFSYEVGDVVGEVEKRTLTGSGARSITVEDVNKICGVTPSTTLDSEYGKEYTKSIYYPTITTETGYSTSKASRTDKYTYYSYVGSEKIATTSNEYRMLFRNGVDTDNIAYWLASCCVGSGSNRSGFNVRYVVSGSVSYASVGHGRSDYFAEYSPSGGVRPIVYLKSDIQTSGKDSSGAWTIIEEK